MGGVAVAVLLTEGCGIYRLIQDRIAQEAAGRMPKSPKEATFFCVLQGLWSRVPLSIGAEGEVSSATKANLGLTEFLFKDLSLWGPSLRGPQQP